MQCSMPHCIELKYAVHSEWHAMLLGAHLIGNMDKPSLYMYVCMSVPCYIYRERDMYICMYMYIMDIYIYICLII